MISRLCVSHTISVFLYMGLSKKGNKWLGETSVCIDHLSWSKKGCCMLDMYSLIFQKSCDFIERKLRKISFNQNWVMFCECLTTKKSSFSNESAAPSLSLVSK